MWTDIIISVFYIAKKKGNLHERSRNKCNKYDKYNFR